MNVFEGKNNYRKQLSIVGENKVLLSRPRTAMFVVREVDVRLHQPLQTLHPATPRVIA